MKKRLFCLFISAVMMLPLFCACAPSQLSVDKPETWESSITEEVAEETETKPSGPVPQSAAEENVMRILIIGNSHTNDVFFQLSRVFNAQGYEKRYMIGFLYYSGCSILQHVEHAKLNMNVYDYYKSDGSGGYTRKQDCTMKSALSDQKWDVIFLHPAKADIHDETLHQNFRRQLEEYIDQYVPTVHTFAWHTSWPNPNEEIFFSDEWWRKAPSGYKKKLVDLYGFDPVRQFTVYTDAAKNHILNDPTYSMTICTGAAIMYATQVLNISQMDLYRDYTHLQDFGRLIVAYAFYAQFTGQPIEEVKMDVLAAKNRQGHYVSQGDLVLTDEMKDVIKSCANYALEHPWEVPGATN